VQLTRNLRLAVAALLALHLASAFAAIAMLGRMRPAVERIMDQNIYSLVAVEEMLSILAGADASTEGPDAQQTRFRSAYDRAAQNITDDRERPILDHIDRLTVGGLPDAAAPRRELVAQLVRLGEVNRDDIVEANAKAQRLGTAGEWALVFLAVLTLASALVALRRMDRRVLQPLDEMYDVLLGLHRGDGHRRCRPGAGASSELARAMASLNRALDDRHEALITATAAEHTVLTGGDEADRATLLQLLDETESPVVVIDGRGDVVASNGLGLDCLAAADGELRASLRAIAKGEQAPEGIDARRVGGAERYICALSA